MSPVDNRSVKLSVMVITYNHEQFIAHALESVLAQRVDFEHEIVVGEDCSTDGTRAILADFHRRYPDRIKLLLKERNIGGLRNLESTIAACRGQYLAILEGDDRWIDPNKLQKQVDFLDTHPDWAVCCHRARFETGPGETEAEAFVFPTLSAGPYTIEDLLRQNFVMTCSAVVRRNLMVPLPSPFSGVEPGDWPRYVLVAKHGKIELMDEVMAIYRVHLGGTWSCLSRLAQLDNCAQMLKTLDKYLGFEYRDIIRETLAGFYLEMASIARLDGRRVETAKHVISHLRNRGWHLPGDRVLAGLAAYSLIGSRYKVFSRSTNRSG
jgi:glycosyltransferase involved in cell wall biosynthesis